MGLFCAASVMAAAALVTPARAGFAQTPDNNTLLNRINELENQVQTLSRAMYHGGPMPAPSAPAPAAASPAALAGYEDRLSQIEQQQRELTGKIEQLSFQVQQLQSGRGGSAPQPMAQPQPVYVPPSYNQQQSYGQAPVANSTYDAGGVAAQSLSAPPQQASAAPRPSPYVGAPYPTPMAQGAEADGSSRALLGSMSTQGPDAADTLYEDAFSDVRDAHYEQAAEKFQKFMAQYPRHSLASNAQYWLAETYYVRADYRQAAKLFAQGYQDYPQGTKAAASLLKLGMSLSRLGKKDDACLSFAQLKKQFPGGQTPEIRAAEDEMKQLGCGGH
jgi:tol-pal system protein YbgF